MKQELRDRLVALGPMRNIERVTVGEPCSIVLRPAPGLARVNTTSGTLALARRHLTLADAKCIVERMVEEGEALAEVPCVESIPTLLGDLGAAGIEAIEV